ncbi:hypothetical protein DFJ73DRAFT_924954 [Zopfochytrium polystomum]|nr:hypothetical protein DFJ73DRAFT_924954 [Zopfochytrium polystomum]
MEQQPSGGRGGDDDDHALLVHHHAAPGDSFDNTAAATAPADTAALLLHQQRQQLLEQQQHQLIQQQLLLEEHRRQIQEHLLGLHRELLQHTHQQALPQPEQHHHHPQHGFNPLQAEQQQPDAHRQRADSPALSSAPSSSEFTSNLSLSTSSHVSSAYPYSFTPSTASLTSAGPATAITDPDHIVDLLLARSLPSAPCTADSSIELDHVIDRYHCPPSTDSSMSPLPPPSWPPIRHGRSGRHRRDDSDEFSFSVHSDATSLSLRRGPAGSSIRPQSSASAAFYAARTASVSQGSSPSNSRRLSSLSQQQQLEPDATKLRGAGGAAAAPRKQPRRPVAADEDSSMQESRVDGGGGHSDQDSKGDVDGGGGRRSSDRGTLIATLPPSPIHAQPSLPPSGNDGDGAPRPVKAGSVDPPPYTSNTAGPAEQLPPGAGANVGDLHPVAAAAVGVSFAESSLGADGDRAATSTLPTRLFGDSRSSTSKEGSNLFDTKAGTAASFAAISAPGSTHDANDYDAATTGASATAIAAASRRRRNRRRHAALIVLAVAALVIAAVSAAVLLARSHASSDPQPPPPAAATTLTATRTATLTLTTTTAAASAGGGGGLTAAPPVVVSSDAEASRPADMSTTVDAAVATDSIGSPPGPGGLAAPITSATATTASAAAPTSTTPTTTTAASTPTVSVPTPIPASGPNILPVTLGIRNSRAFSVVLIWSDVNGDPYPLKVFKAGEAYTYLSWVGHVMYARVGDSMANGGGTGAFVGYVEVTSAMAGSTWVI